MKRFSITRASTFGVAVVSVAILLHLATLLHAADAGPSSGGAAPSTVESSAAAGSQITTLLAAVEVVSVRPVRGGYDRSCSPGDACSFGTEWSDDTTAPDSGNGCDTRNDVLAQDLSAVVFEPGSNDCDVIDGQLLDPYSGSILDYGSDPSAIHIDHIYPLAAAWDFGAADWTQTRRNAFANDTSVELMAVSGTQNLSKSDATPGEWMPPQGGDSCDYLVRYLTVAIAYRLPISAADAQVARTTSC